MAFRLRPRGRAREARQAALDAAEPPEEGSKHPAPLMYTGTTIEPEEGAASRISSAADVDVNMKRHGELGKPGGAGGYGGAGTK